MTHWSIGTPFENIKAAVYPGQPWDLREDNPIPQGYFLLDGRLRPYSDPDLAPRTSSTQGAGVSWDDAASARADALLAEAHAAGWRSPGRDYVAHAVGGGLYARKRLREDAQIEAAVSEARRRPADYRAVRTVGDAAQADSRRAELLEALS